MIKGNSYTWMPFLDTHDPCKLYCTDKDDTLIHAFDIAEDGTSCNIGSNDMCIAGICKVSHCSLVVTKLNLITRHSLKSNFALKFQKVGCDWIVDSNATQDQCGVCGGNGDSCTTIKGEFTKKINMSEGYFEITLIPSGSRHIIIEEMGPSKNYIGVGKSDSKDFYLNGDRLISMPGEYDIAGSLGLYERDNEVEKLKIPGPIKEDISLYVSLLKTVLASSLNVFASRLYSKASTRISA